MYNISITGYGIICAIGNNSQECLTSLKAKKTGIKEIKHLNTKHKGDFLLGEVDLSNEELLTLLDIKNADFKNYTRTSLLGIIAALEAVKNAKINLNDRKITGLVSASSVGGMDKTELQYKNNKSGNEFISTHLCGDSTDKIASYLGINGYVTTISTACSSAANAIMHGARLIKNGIVDRVLVGGTDALSKFTLNGFNSLMICDKELCKPFDNERNGLNLGEGAAFLVLEKESDANGRKICNLTGYANANDAYHDTASSPDGQGAYIAMNEAFLMSEISLDKIDYINAHGTATPNNDLSEGTALKRLFKNNLPPFSSTKAYTGHTLAAAAAVEAVFSIMAIQKGIIFPNLHFSNTIEELAIFPETELQENRNIRNVLSNSFGFGGNNSCLIFSK